MNISVIMSGSSPLSIKLADESTVPSTQYRYYDKDGSKYREGIRNDVFVLDKALTSTGFVGIEDTDWENLKED